MVELSEIKRGLQSPTLKHRREAVKQIELQLSSPRFLRQLDSNTVKLWPEDKIQLLSWPGLVDTYLNYMNKEVTEHKKQLDATAIKVFKTIFTAADNADRCGPGRNNLLRRAGSAFDKFGKMLEVAPEGEGLGTPLGKEIATVLLKVMLPNLAYCQRSTVEAFQGLIEEGMLRFEALQQQIDDFRTRTAQQAAAATATGRLAPAARGAGTSSAAAMQQELFTITNLLTGLLSGVPGQLVGAFVVDVVSFLAQSLNWMDKQGEYGRTSRQLMACLNGLLLAYGADLRPNLPSTHKIISSYVKHAWTAHTSVPVKDGVLCFCRLSLALGSIPTAGSGFLQNDMLSLVTRDMNAPAFVWDLINNKQHQQLAPLAASLYYHAAFTSAAGGTASGSGPAASSGPAATAAVAHEVGSCGSTGDGLGAQVKGKRRASSAEVAATPAAARTAARGGRVSADDGSSDDEVLQLPRKRSRVLGPAEQLLMHLQADPDRWGCIVALLLHQHGPLVPPAFLAALQQQLTATVTRCVTALSQQDAQAAAGSSDAAGAPAAGGLDRRSASPAVTVGAAAGAAAGVRGAQQLQQQLLWVSRCLCELALCWPAMLHPLAAAEERDCARSSTGSNATPGLAAGVDWEAVGGAYNASEGCSQQTWQQADVAAAHAICSSSWQQLWESCVGMLAAAQQLSAHSAVQESMTWLLHVLVVHRLVQLPSKAAELLRLQNFWLPALDGSAGEQQFDPEQQVVLTDAQLALLLCLCMGQQVSSQKEVDLRQQLLQACLSTAEAWSSGSNRRASRYSTGTRAGSMAPPAPVAAPSPAVAGKTLPDLLLPAMLVLLGAPGLPTPSLNGAPAAATMTSAAAAKLAATQSAWLFSAGEAGNAITTAVTAAAGSAGDWASSALGCGSGSSGASVVWYTAAAEWWGADQQLEAQLAGLETGLDTLRRQLAAQQLQQLLAAAYAAVASTASAAGPAALAAEHALSPDEAAAILVGYEPDGSVKQGGAPPAEGSSDAGWWKCWCRLADEGADHLCNALLPFTAAGQDNEGRHPWDASQQTLAAADEGPASAATDPGRQLTYLLLLLNASVSLPCIAALQYSLHQQQSQQLEIGKSRENQMYGLNADPQQAGQGKEQQGGGVLQEVFCGFGFMQHPEQHQQLQQMVMEAGIKAGQLLADNLQHLPCHAGSTWLQQLMHLGGSLARIQSLMTALPTAHGPDNFKVKYQMLAAASFLAEVVKVLERVTSSAAAAAASAEPDEDMDGAGGSDPDFDNDFMGVAPARNRQGATQQSAMSMMGMPATSFRPTQAGSFAASRPAAAAAGPTSTAGTSGPAVYVGGGLAGFSGCGQAGLGSPSAIFSPALLPPQFSAGCNSPSRTPGFAVGGLGEGLSGLAGAEGAGLRVFAALSPAYMDTAQALMRLWVHMAGLTGWAPPETLLQAVVETATTAVCAGGWSHLQQLFGLMKGSHTLLSAQKVPSSTCHLIMRLLQQVAAAAAAAGLRLDMPCALPESQASQEAAELPSQEDPEAGHGTTYLSVMCDIFGDVQRRLGVRHDQFAAESHLPQSTQLQLGLTTLALLQLQPQAGYTTTAQHTEALPTWRQHCQLRLLSSPSSALRARAGPLTATLLTAVAAAASPAAVYANSDNRGNATCCPSIAEFVKVAVAEVSGYLFLQDSGTPTSAQANRVGRRQAALRQMGAAGPAAATAKQEWDATNREAQQDAMAWEAAVLQLADLAHASTAAACVALQQEEPPNVLDAHLLLLLMRHTASVQLLPADALPAHAPGIPGSGSSSQAGSSSDSSSARVRALSLAATALDVMAAQQQYGSRHAYLQYHCRAWAKEWVAAACTAPQLLAISTIMCPSSGGGSGALPSSARTLDAAIVTAGADAAEGAGSTKLLLQAYGSALSFWSIFYGATDELAVLAAAAGLEEAALLQVYTHELCSCVYPLLKVPELKQATDRFRVKLPKTAENLTQEDSYGLVYSMFEISLPVLQPRQQQQPPGLRLDVTLPFITQPLADRGLGQLAKLWDSSNWLLALPFNAAGVQVLLLKAHRSLEAAAHPLHKLQRLGQLQCLVRQLPADRLQSPAVARSLVSMLLQNLQVPELQGACCGCLEQLLAALFAVLPAVSDEQGHNVGHMQGSSTKHAVTAKQQQQQAQQQAQEELVKALLQELLPQVVAALVQCIETAAAGLQVRQQQQLWGLQHSTAAAAASSLRLGGSAAGVAPVDLPSAFAPVSLLLIISLSMSTKGLGLLLDLLPPLPVLAAAAARQGWDFLDVTHLTPWFVKRAAGMTSSSRQRAAQELLSRLRRDPGQVYGLKSEMWRDAGIQAHILVNPGNSEIKRFANNGGCTELAPYPSVVKSSFELARLGAELCDAHVMQLAAELLAVVGPMDPDVITLDHCAAADLYSSVGGYSSTSTSALTKSSSSHADKTAFPSKTVLALLANSLFDQQPQVVGTAQATLGALVSVVDADTLQHILQPPAMEHWSPHGDKSQRAEALLLQSYMQTYISSQGDSPSIAPAPAAVAAALEAATSVDLWSALGKPYKQWLCSLASTLLRACGGVPDTAAAAVVTRRAGRSAAAGLNIPASTTVLALLADAAAISPQLAELLLPHALLKLCQSDHSGADVPGAGSQGWAAQLGAAAAAGLQLDRLTGSAAATWRAHAPWGGSGADSAGEQLSNAETGTGSTAGVTDTRCYSMLLTCLEHNRSINQLALASMPVDPAPAAVAWHRCFCLHLDYLAAAAAAMAVKAYFTAMLYIEQWCFEQQQGGVNPFQGAVADSGIMQLQQLAGLATCTANAGAANGLNSAQHAVQQQQQQLLEQLLLELYSNVNEPDGVYAVVAAFGSPASQLQLLQHEQQWAAVLGGQDALLQAAVLQPAQQQGRGTHVTGVLTALQRFGCPATAQQCIAGALQQQPQQQTHVQQAALYLGLPSSHADQARSRQLQQQQTQQLQEAQQEIAWRLSDWGFASSLNPAAAGQPGFSAGYGPHGNVPAELTLPATAGQQATGFHAAVLAALTALQQHDQEGFTAQVSSAQHDCVLRLARSSAQSAAAVNPQLVQLQMLQMLAQCLLVRKSSPAVAPADWPAKAAQAFLSALSPMQIKADVMAPQAAEKLSGISFELSDQILSLQGALSKALKRPDALLATLQATMKIARRAGQVNFAAAALQQLQETLHQAVLRARASQGVLGLGLPAAAVVGSSGSNGVQLPGWIQRALAAESGWPLEAVKIRWLQGQHQAAIKELKTLAVGLESQLSSMYAATEAARSMTIPEKHAMNDVCCALMQARMLLGKWLAAGEGSTSNIQNAMQQLQSAAGLAPALRQTNLFSVSGDMKQLHSRVCYQLAVCADQHYQMLDAQMASPEFQKQQQVLRTKEQLFEQLRSAVDATKNWARQAAAKQQSAKQAHMQVLRRYSETQRQVDLDRQAIMQLQDSRLQYLTTALGAYRDCIAAGDKHDLQAVYRMCGLWFRHSNVLAVNQVMQHTFQQVPTAKFVQLVYQIASRLDNTQTPFQTVLTDALFLLARDHIYHTLYPLIALSNGDIEGGDPSAKNVHLRHETNTARVAAASALLQRIRAVEPLQCIVDDMTAQVTDLIAMTLQVHKALPRGPGNQVSVDRYTMPANFRRRLTSLRHAPPICYSLPLDTTRRYENVPCVAEIDSTVKIAGGINTPLIIRTTDDSGRTQRQLCKCNDDLRQDAVMQQFFGLVDTLLKGSPASKQRRLGYRTYRVVPCSPLVGVLEWVEGTTPLTEYLLGSRDTTPPYSGGASGRYHKPGGLNWMECYLRIDKAQPKDLKNTFLYCCQHFPPVFRQFFLEAFPYPSDWFEARTRYTRSTAVASMAGAVIGLGDRHLGNILLDMNSAEVVHIDLGIAFEQGLFLQTAERVPFRLTANIVDGMGAAGVEGTFRRCCETTLQVLREHQDALLTVVQVVLHDPLYRWQMTPIKAGRKQLDLMEAAQQQADDASAAPGGSANAAAAAGGTSGVGGAGSLIVSSCGLGNADAERAVLRVKQKLQGQDVEGGAALSVAAQVAAMLQAARDPENLCRMFKGWAPWV